MAKFVHYTGLNGNPLSFSPDAVIAYYKDRIFSEKDSEFKIGTTVILSTGHELFVHMYYDAFLNEFDSVIL